MAQGIKLYNEFKQLVSQTGNIKLAWFTTFNFSVSFFEKYILSALVETNAQDLRNLKDYEALNNRIVNGENGAIDVRVFHDFRAMRPDIKKTSIQTFAIDPAKLDARFNHGVFHPKVGLIVNENDEAWLITGSANMTISAWSNNSEGVIIKKIEDKLNAQKVTDFFLTLMPKTSDKSTLIDLNANWQKKLDQQTASWQFFDSFSNQSILSQLELDSSSKLHIWSPYFSDDLPEIILNQLGQVNEIAIVPDITSSNTIRMSEEVIASLKTNERTRLFRNLKEQRTEDILVHAKIWLTNTKLAVGSWNFTKAGLNLSERANNVEAGIILNSTPEDRESFVNSCNLKELDSPQGMSTELLVEDRKQLLSDWKLTCQVYADWSTYSYRLETEENLEGKDYYIDLPGKKERVLLKQLQQSGASFYNEHKSLLKDRLFTIFDAPKGGSKIFMGVIIELNPKERPALGFDSINELLRAWTDKRPENKTQYHEINYNTDTETGEELSDQISKALKGDYSNAWFTMFLAFEQMKLRIEEEKNNWAELKMIGYNIPGSVSQLSDHLTRLREKVKNEKNDMSESFIWFMINEANLLIENYNQLRKKTDSPEIATIQNIDLNFKNVEQVQMKEWLDFIKVKCDYSHA